MKRCLFLIIGVIGWNACLADELHVAVARTPLYVGGSIRAELKPLAVVPAGPHPQHANWLIVHRGGKSFSAEAKLLLAESALDSQIGDLFVSIEGKKRQIQAYARERQDLHRRRQSAIASASRETRFRPNGGETEGTWVTRPGLDARVVISQWGSEIVFLDKEIAKLEKEIHALERDLADLKKKQAAFHAYRKADTKSKGLRR